LLTHLKGNILAFLFKNWRLPAPYCKLENCGLTQGDRL
jgi:hypothetical protein